MSFDARTLLIVGGFLCWILAAAIEFQAVRPKGGRVMPDAWTLGLLSKGLALNLISQRGLISDAWTISVAQALLLSSLLCFYVALQRIRGVASNRLALAAMPVALAVVLPLIGFSQEAFSYRVFAIMAAWTFGFSLACWAAIRIAMAGYVAGAALVLTSNGVMAVLALAFLVAVATREVSGVFGSNGVQLAFYAIHNVCIAVSTFGYMDIVRAARTRRLQAEKRANDPSQPDALTGLFSAQTFTRLAAVELHRAARSGYPVCAIALRIDGDAPGDEALKQVAALLLREIRMYDVAGRVAPEVFVAVMPELALAKGQDAAERIVARVRSDSAGARSVSVGLCEASGNQQDLEVLMQVALACLERARAEGGNRVVSPAPSGAMAASAA